MKVRSKIVILSVIFMIAVITGFAFITFKWQKPKSDKDRYNEAVVNIAKENSESLSGVSDKDIGEYTTKTLIVKSDKKPDSNAKEVVKCDDLYILKYNSEEETKKAYEKLNKNNLVSSDVVFEVSDNNEITEETKETETKSELRKYLDKQEKREVTVAVIDSGIKDIPEKNVSDKKINYSGEGDTDDVTDNNGHGTKMSNIIIKENSKAKIMPIKVSTKEGKATLLSVYAGIKYAIENKADVINISLNTMASGEAKILEEAINEATSKNIPVVVSAGNKGIDVKHVVPANIESAITVTATDSTGKIQGFSNYGAVDFAAIGENGTSEVAAYVSGIVSIIKSTDKTMSNMQLENILKNYASDFGKEGYDRYYGNGLLSNNLQTKEEEKMDEEGLERRNLTLLEIDWKSLSSEELESIINNTDAEIVGYFLSRLSKEDQKEIKEKIESLTKEDISIDTYSIVNEKGEPVQETLQESINDFVEKGNNQYELKESKTYKTKYDYYIDVYESVKNSLSSSKVHWTNAQDTGYCWLEIYLDRNWINRAEIKTIFTAKSGANATDLKDGVTGNKGGNEMEISISNAIGMTSDRAGYVSARESSKKRLVLSEEKYYTRLDYGISIKKDTNMKYSTQWATDVKNTDFAASISGFNGVGNTIDNNLTLHMNARNMGFETKGDKYAGEAYSSLASIYVYYEVPTYTVTTVAGTGISSTSGGGTFPYGSRPTIGATVQNGYTFQGWYSKKGELKNANSSYEMNALTGDRYRQARAVPNNYTITYHSNYTNGPSDQTQGVTYTQNYTVKQANTFSRTGYTLTGWSTNADGTGTTYTPGSTNTYNTAGNMNLYAQWTPNQYTIQFDLNKGSGSTDPKLNGSTTPSKRTVSYDAVEKINNPTRRGYIFTGWTITEMDSTTHKWGNSSTNLSYTTTATNSNSNKYTYFKNLRSTSGTVKFKANWEEKEAGLYISPAGGLAHIEDMDGRDYEVSSTTKIGEIIYDEEVLLGYTNNKPRENNREPSVICYYTERDGYEFKGWRVKSGGGKITTEEVTLPGYSKTLYVYNGKFTEDIITIEPIWEPKVYSIEYDLNDNDGGGRSSFKSINNELSCTEGTRKIGGPNKYEGTIAKFDVSKYDEIMITAQMGFGTPSRDGYFGYKWDNSSTINYLEFDEEIDLDTFRINTSGHNSITFVGSGYCGTKSIETYLGVAKNPTKAQGDDVFNVENPTRKGYTFAGWTITGMDENMWHRWGYNKSCPFNTLSTTSNDNKCTYFSNLSCSGTVKFKANWIPNEYTLTIDPNGGAMCGYLDSEHTNNWTENPVTRKITFNKKGYKGQKKYQFATTSGNVLPTANGYLGIKTEESDNVYIPYRTGYEFKGWSTTGAKVNEEIINREPNNKETLSYTGSLSRSDRGQLATFDVSKYNSVKIKYTGHMYHALDIPLTSSNYYNRPSSSYYSDKEYKCNTCGGIGDKGGRCDKIITVNGITTAGYLRNTTNLNGINDAIKQDIDFKCEQCGWEVTYFGYPSKVLELHGNEKCAHCKSQIGHGYYWYDDIGWSTESSRQVNCEGTNICYETIILDTRKANTLYTYADGNIEILEYVGYAGKHYYDYTVSSTYAGDTTVTAQWNPIQYTIQFDLNKGSGSTDPKLDGNTSPSNRTVNYDAIEQINHPTRDGYTFTGWTITEMDSTTHKWGNSSTNLSYTTTATNSNSNKYTYFKNLRSTSGTVKFKANWAPIQYTILFDLNKGSGSTDPKLDGNTSPSIRRVSYDAIEAISNPTRTGYTFTGWTITNMDSSTHKWGNSSTNLSETNSSTSSSSNKYTYFKNLRNTSGIVEFKANWAPNQYTVKFDLNKGSGSTTPKLDGNTSPSNRTVTYDVVEQINHPTRDGYTFAGWNITNMDSTTHYWGNDADVSETSVSSTSSNNKYTYFMDLRSTSGTVTFTAQWTPNKYTLTIDPNGSSLCGYLSPTQTNAWTSSPVTRTVTFDSPYHFVTTSGYPQTTENGYLAISTTKENNVNKPYRQGYDFTQWSSSGCGVTAAMQSDASKAYYDYYYGTDNRYGASNAKNATVTAQWKSQVLTIRLDDQKPDYDIGWKDVSPNVIYEKYGVGYYTDSGCSPDKKFTAIANTKLPQRTGYIFEGYYTTSTDGTQIIDKNGELVGSNKHFYKAQDSTNTEFTIYAHWTPISYIVKYSNTSGTGAKDKNDNPVSDYTQTDFEFDTAKSLTANKFRRVYDISYDVNGGQPITTTTANTTATYTFKGWDDQNTFKFHDVTYTKDEFIAPYYANTYSDAKNTHGYDKCGLLRHYIANSSRIANGLGQGYPNQATVKNLTSTQNGTVVLDALWNDGYVTLPDAPNRPETTDGTKYEFIGWFDVKYADDDEYYDYDHLIGKAGDRIVPTKDMTLYARWKKTYLGHPYGFEGEPTTSIKVQADWNNKSTDNTSSDYDIYKGSTIPDTDKVDTNGIAKVTVTANIANRTYNKTDWKGNAVSFTAKAVNNVIKETIDTNKWTYVTSTPVSVSNGTASYSNGVITWKPTDNKTGTITMTYYVKLKEDYWDVAEKTIYDIESKKTEWTYNIGGDSINTLYGESRTNIYEPVSVQMRPVNWNPNKSNGGYVSQIAISSDNSNTKGSAWNFYQKKNETNTYYVKYNTKASEPKSQFKLAFYGVLKRAREGYQINNMYFDSHYSKDSKTQTYDYFTDNLEKIGQKYTWASTTLTSSDWYYAKDITPHTGNKATLLNLVKTENTRSKDTSGIAANSNDPRTKLTSTQTNTVTNGDNGAKISVYPQVRINGDNTYYNTNRYVLSDTDVDSKKISLVVDAKDPTLTYKSGSETNFYDKDTNEGTNINEGNYIDINLTDSYKTEADKTLTFTFGDDVSGISDPDRYSDDWITNSNQNVQVRLERLGHKEDGTIVTNAEYDKMSTSEKAKVSNDPKVIYDNKNNVTNDVININYNDDGLGGNFKVNLKKNNEETLGHLRMTVRIVDNVGNYYDKVYDFYVLKVTGKVELSKYLPRYEGAVIDRTLNIFKKGESGTASISAKGYIDRITAYFGEDMTKWTEDEAKLHNVFASDNYHINGDYPRDYDNSKVTLPAKYQKLAWGYENDELGGLPVKLSSQYTKTITVTKETVNNNLAALKNGNVVIVPATYENGALVQDSYTLQFSTEVNGQDLPKYIIVNGKDKAKLTWKDGKVSFDKITTTSTDWVTVNGEKLRPMIHAFYVPFGASEGDYTVIVTAYKDGHKVRIGIPYSVDGNILNDIRTRIRDN